MIIFGENVGDVAVHFEATGAFGVISVKVDTRKAVANPVLQYITMLLEDVAYILIVALFTNVFNTKVLNNYIEYDGYQFVVPEEGSGSTLLLYSYVEIFSRRWFASDTDCKRP